MSVARNQATAPPLSAYRLAARSGSGNIRGVFLDARGYSMDFFDVAVSTAGWVALSPPDGAVGAVITSAVVDLIILPTSASGDPLLIADAIAKAPFHTSGTRNIALGVVAS